MKKIMLLLFFAFAAMFQLSADEHWFAKKFTSKLTDKNGRTVNAADALKGKTVAVYFSASWCGPCRGFTPTLVNFYKTAAKQSKIELIFVSSDKDAAAMMQYMQKYSMPWLAVPFDSGARGMLKNVCKVSGIPKLVVFDENGKIISQNARWDVVMLGSNAVDAWKKEDYVPRTYQDFKNARQGNSEPAKQAGGKTAKTNKRSSRASKQELSETAKKIKEQAKFKITAWGYDKDNINTPFSPDEKMNIPLKKDVYFKVVYEMPQDVTASIMLKSRYGRRPLLRKINDSNGEFVARLCGTRNTKDNSFFIVVKLNEPGSRGFVAAKLPCNIVWGNAE